MPESAGVVSGVSSEGTKRSLEEETSSSKEGTSSGSGTSNKRVKQDLQGLPTRQYLDQTVVPILLQVCVCVTGFISNENWVMTSFQGLASLARERPRDPIEYLAGYLLRCQPYHNHKSNQALNLGHLSVVTIQKLHFFQAQTRVWPRWSVEGVLWFCFYTWIGWLATLPPNFYILIGWHSCMESTNLDRDVCHLWV